MSANIERYLRKRADNARRPLIASPPEEIDQVVVIPVFREEAYLPNTLRSVEANDPDELAKTLVICVVNNPEGDPDAASENARTLAWLQQPSTKTRLHVGYIDASSDGCALEDRGGVGTARKLGFDWAVDVLQSSHSGRRPLLLSLDADSPVEKTYLGAFRQWGASDDTWSAVACYEHPLPEDPRQRAAVAQYELYMRYHTSGLRYAGSPYAYPAIGSTIACTVDAYVAAGGMNRRQAGEDFYFLQELAKTGPVLGITGTTVKPSGRASGRVPFGTGPRVRELIASGEGMEVYHPQVYEILRRWLELVSGSPDAPGADLVHRLRSHAEEAAAYFVGQRFAERWDTIRMQAPSRMHLMRQFHRWFDGFRTLKFIHYLRDHGFPSTDLLEAVERLAELSGAPVGRDHSVEGRLHAARARDREPWQAGLPR